MYTSSKFTLSIALPPKDMMYLYLCKIEQTKQKQFFRTIVEYFNNLKIHVFEIRHLNTSLSCHTTT